MSTEANSDNSQNGLAQLKRAIGHLKDAKARIVTISRNNTEILCGTEPVEDNTGIQAASPSGLFSELNFTIREITRDLDNARIGMERLNKEIAE